MGNIQVAAMYQFVTLPDYKALRQPLLDLLHAQGVRGTLLLANEGINGTIAGSEAAIATVVAWLQEDGRFDNLAVKYSHTEEMPFKRPKVKLKQEIVTMGVPLIDPQTMAGDYVDAQQWNQLLQDPDVTVVDCRNDYEVAVGSFNGAINPQTNTFREFPEYVAKNLNANQHKKVAMFCTGGIRCEKSTAYLKQQGFDEVYHLRGGILKYLEEVEPAQSQWHGECFVFDERVTVTEQLQAGSYAQCHACRRPISAADQAHVDYVQGVSCPHCINETDLEQRQRFAEREKQIALAKARGVAHIGQDARQRLQQQLDQKHQAKQLDNDDKAPSA